ncbi:hypothetical protein [Actinokineospora xionganensis]|uniref:Diadenosine tetraphosphate (Ap4A) HIT family hydrolase n=1 Tax=Actinokineospora xionganensis TaxID=2684470 RepID=A0ABR7L7G7_9PSEU|nr:hypothetical protein [Actinokineospora xionganensis]MBC6448488.1 hypothetical protein [Actinokineospora xionganensis]
MSEHLAAVPFGETGTLPPFADWATFPFTGDLRVKPFETPVLPEPPRAGAGGVDCEACDKPDEDFLWSDDHWRVGSTREPSGLPAVLFLFPREHYDLVDLPPALAASYGPMIQRVERAYLSLGGIGRVHQNKWGDGAEHLHLWFFGRPAGMLQFRGSFLTMWDDVLPPIPTDQWRDNLHRIAASLAEGGGTAYA